MLHYILASSVAAAKSTVISILYLFYGTYFCSLWKLFRFFFFDSHYLKCHHNVSWCGPFSRRWAVRGFIWAGNSCLPNKKYLLLFLLLSSLYFLYPLLFWISRYVDVGYFILMHHGVKSFHLFGLLYFWSGFGFTFGKISSTLYSKFLFNLFITGIIFFIFQKFFVVCLFVFNSLPSLNKYTFFCLLENWL